MVHITIFLYIISLAVGVLAAFHTNQKYNTHRDAYLLSFVWYIICFNLVLLSNLTLNYIFTNLLGNVTKNRILIYQLIVSPMGFLLIVGMTYTFLRVVMGLQAKTLSSRFKSGFAAGCACIFFSYGVGVREYIQNASLQWFNITHMFVNASALFVSYIALIGLIIQKKADYDTYKRKAVNAFGVLYLSGYTCFFIAFALPSSVKIVAISATSLLVNLLPFIWFKYFFSKTHWVLSSIEDNPDLYTIYKKYHISKREQEIIELIMRGKSNKEIAEKLFIAIHTVKNHIYSLYQKLGVKSRGQLVHFILNIQRRD